MWIIGIAFQVECVGCDYRNRPSRNTRKSIEMTLLGEFKKCRGCHMEFEEIIVPERKLVKKAIESIGKDKIHPMIRLVDCNDGRYDQAVGIIVQVVESSQ